jgi:DNA mismatch repair ATPase MutS
VISKLYFDQAEQYAPLLNIKLASKKTSLGRVAMAGFPYFQLDRYLKVLVQDMQKHVAISEEFANEPAAKVKSGGLLFDRKVTRVITPGTLIDENFMDPWENNFLLSINVAFGDHGNAQLGLAWLDLSSGDFFTQISDVATISSTVARIGPREILVSKQLQLASYPQLDALLKEDHHIVTFVDSTEAEPELDWKLFLETDVDLNVERFAQTEIEAGNALLQYLQKQLQGNVPKLRHPLRRHAEEYMLIDKNSLRALEIRSTLKDGGFEGSLLHAVRRTVTKSGTRLLSQRLISPLTSLEEINDRLDLVTQMLENPILRDDLVMILRMTFDSLRLLQKFTFGRGDADDLLGLARTIHITAQIADLLEGHIEEGKREDGGSADTSTECLAKLLGRLSLEGPQKLADRIADAIDEDMLSEQHQLEDNEAAAVVEMAEGVLSRAGEDTKISGIPKSVKAKLGQSDRERPALWAEDVWIMRKEYVSSLPLQVTRTDTSQSKRYSYKAPQRTRHPRDGKSYSRSRPAHQIRGSIPYLEMDTRTRPHSTHQRQRHQVAPLHSRPDSHHQCQQDHTLLLPLRLDSTGTSH